MGDPLNLPPVPNLQLTLPPLFARPRRFGTHLLPDLHLNPPVNPFLPSSVRLNPVSGRVDGGFSILSNSSRYFNMRFDPPPNTGAPLFTFPPVQLGNPLTASGASLHTDLPFGLDYSGSPDMSGTVFHQLNFWINKDLASPGPFGIFHQFGIANSFSDGASGSGTQVGGWTASTTLFNIDFRSDEQKHNNTGVELGLGQVGTNLGPGGFINGRSYSVGTQLEIHHNEQWSLIFSGTLNFAPPDSNPGGRTGFSNAMFTITFVKTHLIIPPN